MLDEKSFIFFGKERFYRRKIVNAVHVGHQMHRRFARRFTPIEIISTLSKSANVYATAIPTLFVKVFKDKAFF
jgi:hypothetical protein